MPALNLLTETPEARLKLVIDLMRVIARAPESEVHMGFYHKAKRDSDCGSIACLAGWATTDAGLRDALDIKLSAPFVRGLYHQVCELERQSTGVPIGLVSNILSPDWLSQELFSIQPVSTAQEFGRTQREEALFRLWLLAGMLVDGDWNLYDGISGSEIWDARYVDERYLQEFAASLGSINRCYAHDSFWTDLYDEFQRAIEKRRGLESNLYYEAHITIEPVFDDRLTQVAELARLYKFKVADLLMKKRAQDTEERSANDTFMTAHGKYLDEMRERVTVAVKALQAAGFKVWRYKVEDTMFDSRTEDVLNLLGDRNG